MLLSILDEKTFMVGGKVYKVGTKLNLAEMATPLTLPWGHTCVPKLNEHLMQVSKMLRETRTNLANRLHEVDDDFDEVAACLAVDYESLERDWLYYSDLFYKAIQDHIGGQLPLIRDPETGDITVRPKQPNETLNYLRDVCAQRVRFHNYESMRHLALHMVGGKKANVKIESEFHIETQVPIVSADFLADTTTAKEGWLIEWLEKAVVETYDSVVRYGPVAGVIWLHASHTESRAYFLNAGALLRAGQGDPKLALTTAIQRCQDKLPHPYTMGFFIYGNMPIAKRVPKEGEDEKKIPTPRGVLISALSGDTTSYKILTVAEDQTIKLVTNGDDATKLDVAQEGDESKLDQAIIDVARAAMKDPEEESPKEE